MSDPSPQSDNVIESFTAGLPAMPPSAKVGLIRAIGYLFGGVANYLAAWMRRPTQGIDDKTAAKSLIVEAVAKAAAEVAANDPEIVNAAVKSWLPKELRRQENKARVIEQAAAALADGADDEEPPVSDVEEDWLNAFERFCEDASSERMQQLWGRVLAREVTSPGSFSKSTIRLISEIDQDVARHFEDMSFHVLDGNIFLLNEDDKRQKFGALIELENSGLIAGASGFITWNPNIDENKRFGLGGRTLGIVGKVKERVEMSVEAIPLTAQGKQILRILAPYDERKKLLELSDYLRDQKAGLLNKAEVTGIALCKIVKAPDNTRRFAKLEQLWGEDPF